MTEPVGQDDAPLLGEIGRTLTDFRSEVRAALASLVRRDVYDAQRNGDLSRIEGLERWRAETAADQRSIRAQVRVALVVAVLAVVGSVAAALILAALTG